MFNCSLLRNLRKLVQVESKAFMFDTFKIPLLLLIILNHLSGFVFQTRNSMQKHCPQAFLGNIKGVVFYATGLFCHPSPTYPHPDCHTPYASCSRCPGSDPALIPHPYHPPTNPQLLSATEGPISTPASNCSELLPAVRAN